MTHRTEMISLDEAIGIYSRAMRRWFGSNAPVQAEAKANELAAGGDCEGRDVWLNVALATHRMVAINGSGDSNES